MLKNFNIENIADEAIRWLTEHFWSVDMLYQAAIVIIAYLLGNISGKLLRRRINAYLEKNKPPIAVKRVATNMVKLLVPICALLFGFLLVQIASAPAIAVDVNIVTGIMKLLFAWIVIRIAVQFISNSAVRNAFSFIIWTLAALSIFSVLDETALTLDSFAFTIGNFRLSALAVIKSLLMIFVLLYIAIFVSGFAERRILKVKGLTRSSQVLVTKVIRVLLIVFALLIGITSAGIDLSLFAVFGGAVGLGIGFGLQKGISNLFSGMLLLMDQSIKPGDVIEIPDLGTFGWVNTMAARYTEIVTRDNKSFLIPNEDFITQRVVNWSHGNSLIRLEVKFGVHYDSDPHEVKAMVENKLAGAHNRVVDTPSPVCHLEEFGDSSLNFTVRFWIKDAEQGVTNIRGDIMLVIWDILKENNISIPYPHREIFQHIIK
ncbi:MAG: mechanosensitive ion channel [Micavibrio sp.]|nr:mechanosensitive ion channel [Micavibrio sp.]